jgi:hypothetical protein
MLNGMLNEIFVTYYNFYLKKEGPKSARFGAAFAIFMIQLFCVGIFLISTKLLFKAEFDLDLIINSRLIAILIASVWIFGNYFFYSKDRVRRLLEQYNQKSMKSVKALKFISWSLPLILAIFICVLGSFINR